ncbi:MAG: Glu/Leu/Phe/Val family dehydrogenase, partial [Gaiellales bacterium]
MRLFNEHEQVVICHEPEAGLRALIAVHDTTLGPALGGIRMWTYDSDEAALTDVLRLSRGMTYKNSAAGLPLGGGKTVVIGDPRTQKSELMFRALGRFIESIGGRYLAAEDVGTSTADAEIVARETRHITGLPVEKGGSGDPSPMTAWGVVCGMRAAIEEAGIGDDFAGVRVAVQGAGHVGGDVVRHLLEAGARVTVADIYADRIEPLVALGAEAGDPRTVHSLECDVYSPCALGAVIRPETVAELRCRVVAGAANNQLLDGSMG